MENFKPQKPVKNASYLAKVRALPCVICESANMVQCSPTEAHHVFSGRYGHNITSDTTAIPLCHSHHHKMRAYRGDEWKVGIHDDKRMWEDHFGPDTDYIERTQKRILGD